MIADSGLFRYRPSFPSLHCTSPARLNGVLGAWSLFSAQEEGMVHNGMAVKIENTLV